MSQMGPIKANETVVKINEQHQSLRRHDYEEEEFESDTDDDEEPNGGEERVPTDGGVGASVPLEKLFADVSAEMSAKIDKLRQEFTYSRQTFQREVNCQLDQMSVDVKKCVGAQQWQRLEQRIDQLEDSVGMQNTKIDDACRTRDHSVSETAETFVKGKLDYWAGELEKSIDQRLLNINTNVNQSIHRQISQLTTDWDTKLESQYSGIKKEMETLKVTISTVIGNKESNNQQYEAMKQDLDDMLKHLQSTCEQNSADIDLIQNRIDNQRNQSKVNLERLDGALEQLNQQIKSNSVMNANQVKEMIACHSNTVEDRLTSIQHKIDTLILEQNRKTLLIESTENNLKPDSTEPELNISREQKDNLKQTSKEAESTVPVTENVDYQHLLSECLELKQILVRCMEHLPAEKSRSTTRKQYYRRPTRTSRKQPSTISSEYPSMDSLNESSLDSEISHSRLSRQVKFKRVSQSTPNLCCCQHWKADQFGSKRPLQVSSEALKVPSHKSGKQMTNRIQNIQQSSDSLIGLIRQTSEQLKNEIASLQTLGQYQFVESTNHVRSRGTWPRKSDENAIQRLRAIRTMVNDRLKRMSLAIDKQKVTQI